MPPGPRCTKCHQIAAAEGDSWCTGCSAWEFLGRELTASWDSEGARVLAGDLAVTAARQVKALRSLSSGLARVAGGPSAGTGRAEVPVPAAEPKRRAEQPHTGRDSLPRRRAPLPPPPLPPKEEESEEGEESEEETRDRSVGRRAHKEKPGTDTAIPGDLRAKLREKLAAAKKMKDAGTPAADVEESEVVASSEEKSSYTDEEEPLGTGTTLPTRRPPALRRGDGAHAEEVEDPSAIRDISTRSWSGQLALKALEVTNQEAKKKKKKKSKHPGKEMAEALAKILTRDGKKKKKKKKRKRTVLADGTIRSYSASSSASSDSEEEEGRVRDRSRSPGQETKPGQTGKCAGNVGEPCQRSNGTSGTYRSSPRSSSSDFRGEVSHILRPTSETGASHFPEGTEGNAFPRCYDGPPQEWRHSEGWRLVGSALHGATSKHPGQWMDHGALHGTTSYGRKRRRIGLNCPGLTKTWKVSRQGTRERNSGMGQLGLGSARSWKRRLERVRRFQQRWQGRERKGQRSRQERKAQGQPRDLGRENLGLGQEQGDTRGQVMGGSLEKSVESKRPSLVSTTGWSEVLSCCTTLKRSGCALAWCLAHGCNITELHDTVFQVRDFFTPGMKHRVARKRAIFPLHEGDFASALRPFCKCEFNRLGYRGFHKPVESNCLDHAVMLCLPDFRTWPHSLFEGKVDCTGDSTGGCRGTDCQ